MSRRAPGRTLASWALAGGLVGGLVVGAVATAPQAAAAPTGTECSQLVADTEDDKGVTGNNEANRILHVEEATEYAARLGRSAKVDVVVVDAPFGSATAHKVVADDGHGLAVAGIVAGPDQSRPVPIDVGIAPRARVVDRWIYGQSTSGDDPGPKTAVLAARLNEIAGESLPRRTIVLVPNQVEHSADLEAALDRVVEAGALVIAASGDRTLEPWATEFANQEAAGEDAVSSVWPAAHEDVLSVGVSTPESASQVLRNSGVDLAAPGVGAVSLGRNGGWCAITTVSTHWAAAQVAGVAALVWSAHPDDTAAELRDRLERTASGNGEARSPLTGHGIVQPLEALALTGDEMSELGHAEERIDAANVPRERADLLADARHDAVWWGIAGGGVLVVLLLLRPVLHRRR